jgi:hypothetical protein
MKTVIELGNWIESNFDCIWGFKRAYAEFHFEGNTNQIVFEQVEETMRGGNDALYQELLLHKMFYRFSAARVAWLDKADKEMIEDGRMPLLLWRKPLMFMPDQDNLTLSCRVGFWNDYVTEAIKEKK